MNPAELRSERSLKKWLQRNPLSVTVATTKSISIEGPTAVTSTSRSSLDEVSRAIIEQLQEDGRRPYAAIGKAVGLSEAAVRQRVQKLVDSGVMQIVAVTDPSRTGFARQAMISISVCGDVEKIAAHLADIDEVDYIVVTAGSVDLMVEVVVTDDAHLLELVNQRIRTIDGVVRTESYLYLKLVKQTYNWGAR